MFWGNIESWLEPVVGYESQPTPLPTSAYIVITLVVVIIGAIIGTLWLSPDLDLKSDAYYRWGPLKFIWLPYVKLMPHRSLFSHLPVLSDLIRIAYIGFPLILLLPFTAYETEIRSWVDVHGMSFFLGLVFATTLHTTLDYTSTFFKKAF